MSNKNNFKARWLLFFYSVPSKPVNNRIKIWRRLVKAGAVQLKGAVYILPYSDEHYEFLQWLVSEVTSLKGDASFLIAGKVETMTDREVIDLFDQQREADCRNIQRELEGLERRVNSIKKGAGAQNIKKLSEQFNKQLRAFEEIKKIDFFSSKAGNDLKKRIKSIEGEIKIVSGFAIQEKKVMIIPKRIEDYQGKTWVTRKKPFVDRMASAWLIKRFIDKNAVFRFIDEREMGDMDKNCVTFDVRGGEITHMGNLCTFEVFATSFEIKNKAVKKISELVHELDMKDDRYKSPEAKGIEDILLGIRKTAKNDSEALEKGMYVFEMLYVSKI